MRTVDFDYALPDSLIAQRPVWPRDHSKLLVLRRADGVITHRQFLDLPAFLRPGDVLVLNDSRVIPARLFGTKAGSKGRVELLLLEENQANDWWTMLRPGKRCPLGTSIELLNRSNQPTEVRARIVEKNTEGHCRVLFSGTNNVLDDLNGLGATPLPPYLRRKNASDSEEDRERYQTIFARPPGSVAAPTAGLHFTNPLFDQIRAAGVGVCFVTLHVGPGTFAPVKADRLDQHVMHVERFQIDARTAETISAGRRNGGRIIAVGTTTVRVLETVALMNAGRLTAFEGKTRAFIHPPSRFQVVDALITNFHLPRSTLLMLVSAFAAPGELRGRELVLAAYTEAIRERYRFFSYGDAMLII